MLCEDIRREITGMQTLVGVLNGVVLTGGGDVDPVLYGEDRHESVEDAEPGRDEFEIDLARRAMATDLPLLAICRGAQVLNVAVGGTLIQDIPSSVESVLKHAISTPRDALAHEVSITPGSRLHEALVSSVAASGSFRVNSRHHQSVGRLGTGLVATATASDGVVEAIEQPEARFCLGIQWHPENFWRTGEFKPLFESFVAAARERMTESEF